MGPLAAVERFFERLFERPSARLFHTHLQPVQLLRRVERAMETGRLTGPDAVLVPEHLVVRIHPTDLAAFGGEAPALAGELADGALRFARAHGYRLRERPRVDLVPDGRAEPGAPSVEARFEGSSSGSGRVAHTAAPAAGFDPPAGSWPGETVTPHADDRTMVFARPALEPPLARLRVLEPHGGDRAVTVGSAVLTIGRGAANSLVLSDKRVSRVHARLQVRQGRLVLVDLGSRNGTRVNGVPIDEVVLGLGDEILVGDTRLIVEAPAAAPAGTPAPGLPG